MFKRILVPTDGSELSLRAINTAVQMAKAFGASVTGVTIVEPYSYSGISEYRPESLDDYESRMDKLATTRLEPLETAAKASNVLCTTVVKKSFAPYEAIIDTAKQKECDLIIMASHGRRGLAGVLLGSETQKVLTHSTIPALVVR
jgi:nucleotide-binding universal stress UspA family protein